MSKRDIRQSRWKIQPDANRTERFPQPPPELGWKSLGRNKAVPGRSWCWYWGDFFITASMGPSPDPADNGAPQFRISASLPNRMPTLEECFPILEAFGITEANTFEGTIVNPRMRHFVTSQVPNGGEN